jgi:hypothetical protein
MPREKRNPEGQKGKPEKGVEGYGTWLGSKKGEKGADAGGGGGRQAEGYGTWLGSKKGEKGADAGEELSGYGTWLGMFGKRKRKAKKAKKNRGVAGPGGAEAMGYGTWLGLTAEEAPVLGEIRDLLREIRDALVPQNVAADPDLPSPANVLHVVVDKKRARTFTAPNKNTITPPKEAFLEGEKLLVVKEKGEFYQVWFTNDPNNPKYFLNYRWVKKDRVSKVK